MNECQYDCFRQNRGGRTPLRLDEVPARYCGRQSAVGVVLAVASQRLRRRQAAEVAWQRVARSAWLAETKVDRVHGDTLVIVVSGSALCYELGRQKAALQQELSRLVPEIRSLDFLIGGHQTSAPPASPRGEGD